MDIGYGLTLEQTQKLTLTPELIQSIKILQFSSAELESYVEDQIMNNPVLESEIQVREDAPSYSSRGERSQGIPFERNDISSTTLNEHLLFQLQFVKAQKQILDAAKYIIEILDDNGYLTQTSEEIILSGKYSMDDVLNALDIVREFDPAGVAASDLKECLILQLKAAGTCTEIKEEIINSHLELIGLNRLGQISKALDISVTEVQEIVNEIKKLDPKPGRAFASSSDETRYVTPDIYLEKEDGQYKLLLSESRLPKLSVSPYYSDMMNQNLPDAELKTYLTEHIKSANWLIKAIEQRNSTIYNVANAIVKYQEKFFDEGEKYLKPLLLKQIAEEVGVHESTVSRTINGKYMQTPKGLFELKFFFSSGVTDDSGEGVSSRAVKMKIKEMVDAENPKKPVSDQKITDELNKEGIDISRRTVAKYREEMGIYSSQKRKQY